jgi:plasmid maintenance system antidote protein VapI
LPISGAINGIVHGKRSITPSMSIRFGAFFGQSDTFWHGIQAGFDFRALAKDRKKLTAGIKPTDLPH